MPTWGEILTEVQKSAEANQGQPDLDGIRRRYLVALNALTGRDVILYSTDWLQSAGPMTSISLEDMQGMMEVSKGLHGPNLDLILHSPGGAAEATASLVHYLRQRYAHVRVFVPVAAMSAATMWALSADEIVMGDHSQLGPIDPQLVTSQGAIPARAILDQFDRAKEEAAENPAALGAWYPILQQYGPALLKQCENAEKLAKRLVREWLRTYMFADDADRVRKARRVADFFGDHSRHHSHSLGITRETAAAKGVKVVRLEEDAELQDAVLSVHHAAMHTFVGPAVKIIENHHGRGFFKLQQTVQFQGPPPGGMIGVPLVPQ